MRSTSIALGVLLATCPAVTFADECEKKGVPCPPPPCTAGDPCKQSFEKGKGGETGKRAFDTKPKDDGHRKFTDKKEERTPGIKNPK